MVNNNNNQNAKKQFTPEAKLAELVKVNMGVTIEDIGLSISTANIQNEALRAILRDGISEVDKVMSFPVYDRKTREIVDFGLIAFFRCSNAADSNISKIGYNNKSNFGNIKNNSVNMTGFISNQSYNGGYKRSDKFDNCIAPMARLGKDGELIIRDGNRGRRGDQMAIVDLDFWYFMDNGLNCTDANGCQYKIVDCIPMDNGNGGRGIKDYKLKICKYISKNQNKKGRYNTNYNYDDAYNDQVNYYAGM